MSPAVVVVVAKTRCRLALEGSSNPAMKPLAHAFLASALAGAGVAQNSGSEDGIRVWAAVAYVNHGDKLPYNSMGDQILVPQGAQQLRRQGAAFRARYLNQTSGDDGETISVTPAPIRGLSAAGIRGSQLDIAAAGDEWVVAGAQAFMQGLYPPILGSVTGDAARNLANETDSVVEYPLGGYQYPAIQAVSSLDKNSPGYEQWSFPFSPSDIACLNGKAS